MTPTLVDSVVGQDANAERGALGDAPESIAQLKKTLAALAHVHDILVCLRDRAAQRGVFPADATSSRTPRARDPIGG